MYILHSAMGRSARRGSTQDSQGPGSRSYTTSETGEMNGFGEQKRELEKLEAKEQNLEVQQQKQEQKWEAQLQKLESNKQNSEAQQRNLEAKYQKLEERKQILEAKDQKLEEQKQILEKKLNDLLTIREGEAHSVSFDIFFGGPIVTVFFLCVIDLI